MTKHLRRIWGKSMRASRPILFTFPIGTMVVRPVGEVFLFELFLLRLLFCGTIGTDGKSLCQQSC